MVPKCPSQLVNNTSRINLTEMRLRKHLHPTAYREDVGRFFISDCYGSVESHWGMCHYWAACPEQESQVSQPERPPLQALFISCLLVPALFEFLFGLHFKDGQGSGFMSHINPLCPKLFWAQCLSH